MKKLLIIIHHVTIGYAPQQNSFSERKNKFTAEMARCMPEEKALLKVQMNTVYTTIYLQSRGVTTRIHNKTPIEAWSAHRS